MQHYYDGLNSIAAHLDVHATQLVKRDHTLSLRARRLALKAQELKREIVAFEEMVSRMDHPRVQECVEDVT